MLFRLSYGKSVVKQTTNTHVNPFMSQPICGIDNLSYMIVVLFFTVIISGLLSYQSILIVYVALRVTREAFT